MFPVYLEARNHVLLREGLSLSLEFRVWGKMGTPLRLRVPKWEGRLGLEILAGQSAIVITSHMEGGWGGAGEGGGIGAGIPR